MIIPSPDQLVEQGASVLAKFGYEPFGGEEEHWSAMWDLLKGDFTTQKHPEIPSFDDLSLSLKEAAKVYMRRRLIADRFFEECRKAQADLFKGIDTDGVERYTIARDAYEDSVGDFGAARERIAMLLDGKYWEED
ncbi:hypothetical protein SAMN02745127_02623 [Oceanospirillum multiglobuliferum]|uniref:hypothetical protein n=1 Tax=Oceanospirillum multiglobuliferum TaxID=64969 RepID=UPI0009C4D7F6|nr:hypothetical protein [Oceanospirillum multiglobuliferum]SKA20458.1 hypothetical protein SAMN02745127_02623 [Oceanospirillum multiglobuliferum]